MTVIDADLAALDPDLQFDDLGSIVARRISGRFVVDEWGLDADLRRIVSPLVRARWSLRLEGEGDKAVAVVRFGSSEKRLLLSWAPLEKV